MIEMQYRQNLIKPVPDQHQGIEINSTNLTSLFREVIQHNPNLASITNFNIVRTNFITPPSILKDATFQVIHPHRTDAQGLPITTQIILESLMSKDRPKVKAIIKTALEKFLEEEA